MLFRDLLLLLIPTAVRFAIGGGANGWLRALTVLVLTPPPTTVLDAAGVTWACTYGAPLK